jgi:DNA modification methylase
MAEKLQPNYQTKLGSMFNCSIEDFVMSSQFQESIGKVDLIFTSPPFPLASPKKYGNLVGEEYVRWLVEVTNSLVPLLSDTGSLVMEIGNAWDKGQPTMSILPMKTLLAIVEETELSLCQQFVWENSARLPGPATWTNKERIRIKDSHTNIWWYGKTIRPKANNRKVLKPYTAAMQRLIDTGKFNPGLRPSGHQISEDHFAKNNGGSIPGSTFILGNTQQDAQYDNWCKAQGVPRHPARMPAAIPNFFIKFLTDEGDVVLDPFAGSNTTGESAESLNRRWIAVERDENYVAGSRGRFDSLHA